MDEIQIAIPLIERLVRFPVHFTCAKNH